MPTRGLRRRTITPQRDTLQSAVQFALNHLRAPSRTTRSVALLWSLLTAAACGESAVSVTSARGMPTGPPNTETPSLVPLTPATPLFQEVVLPESDLGNFQYKGIGALAVGDVDGDGLQDIVTAADFAVFRNLGHLQFEDVTPSSGVELGSGLSLALGDMDNDSDLDLVVSGFQKTQVWANDGSGHFSLAYEGFSTAELGASNIVLLDLNNDGLLDIFLAYPASFNFRDPRVSTATLLNAGALDFTESSSKTQRETPAIAWAAAIIDFDRDGDMDVYVANDSGVVDYGFGQKETRDLELPGNHLWMNKQQPEQDLVEAALQAGLNGRYSAMGALVEDFNGDGLFDIFTPDFGRNKIHLAQQDGGFSEAAQSLGLGVSHLLEGECHEHSEDQDCLLVSWGSAYRDFDLDGDSDLLVLNHREEVPQPAQLFVHSDSLFTEADSGIPLLAGHSLVPVDLDTDGDLDLLITTYYGQVRVFENTTRSIATTGDANRWLQVRLEGAQSNRAGIGAVVEATLSFDGVTRSESRLVGAGGVAHASLPTAVHFGLGEAIVTRLAVRWPSGAVSYIDSPSPNRTLTVSESFSVAD